MSGRGAAACAVAVLVLVGAGGLRARAGAEQDGAAAQGASPAPGATPAPPAAPNPDHKVHFEAQEMGTVVDLTLWTDDDKRAAEAAQAVFAEFKRLDLEMSNWVDSSDVQRINQAAGVKAVRVSDEVFKIIQRAQQVSRKTDGAFDITIGAYRGLWKFDQEMDGSLPADAEVQARRKMTGYRDLVLDARHKTVKLRRKGMGITLGGIAKGYAVDRAVAILHERGMVDFIVQAGGDLYVAGKKGSQKWRVGIRDPRGSRDATFALTEIENKTFSTSGDYERGFVKDGVRYHHILNPKTGYPAKLCRSVTVMAKDAITADAWSTALFVLGPDKGLKLVARMPELQAVFVDSHNNVLVSSGLTLVHAADLHQQLAGGLENKILLLRPPTDAP